VLTRSGKDRRAGAFPRRLPNQSFHRKPSNTRSADTTKYVIKTNKPLSDVDDDEVLHLLVVPTKMTGAVYMTKSGKSDGLGKITPCHTHDLLHWCYLAGCAFEKNRLVSTLRSG
jgi:hypothetical protein